MALPDGWSVELPNAVHAHSSFATCDVSYRFQDGKLFADRRLAVLQSKVPVGDYKQYQAWYDMGWLLYKEGNSAEALSYAEAAVQSNMSTIRHEHLTAIATVLHSHTASAFARKTDQQLRTLRLGAAKGRHGVVEVRMIIVGGKAIKLGEPATNPQPAPPSSDFDPPATLPGIVDLVKSADFQSLLPAGSAVHLVRIAWNRPEGTEVSRFG